MALDKPSIRGLKYPEHMFPGRKVENQQARNISSLHTQRDFMVQIWAPALQKIGITDTRQAGALLIKFLHPIGNIYRETDVDHEVFVHTLGVFAQNMADHLQKLKWYLKANDWQTVVDAVEAADDPMFTFLMRSGKRYEVNAGDPRPPSDPTDDVRETLYEVHLPHTGNDQLETRIRLDFPAKGVDPMGNVLEVTNNVARRTRTRMNAALQNAA